MYSFFAAAAVSVWFVIVGMTVGFVVMTFHAAIYGTWGRSMNVRQETGSAMLGTGILALVSSYGPGGAWLWLVLPVWAWRLLFLLVIVVGWILMIPDDWWRRKYGLVTAKLKLKQVRYLAHGVSARRPLPV